MGDDFELWRRDRMTRQELWGVFKGLVFFTALVAFLVLPFTDIDIPRRNSSGDVSCSSVWDAAASKRSTGDPDGYAERCAATRTKTVAAMVVLVIPLSMMFSTWQVRRARE